MDDQSFLKEAIAMAAANVERGGGPFGALIVKDGEVVGRGVNQVTKTNDPTAHAEVVAIRETCRNLGQFKLDGCVLYTSCEPCPMCLGAIYWAHISRIVYAAGKTDAAKAGFDDSFIYEQFAVGPQERSIPAKGISLKEAAEPFQRWQNLESRVEY
ncbi:MAG TPA: nucleoside deaminase [Bacteroidales bacterium]|nr:nucleoside deaminase [Bacteroidales bacterium]